MDPSDLAAQGSDHQKSSKVLTLEQQRKLEDLRERRLQVQKAQDVANSRKRKKKRKKDQKINELNSEVADGASEQQQDHPSIEEDRATTQMPAKFGSDKRHIFAINAETGKPGDGSFSQHGGAAGGEGNLSIEPLTTVISPSEIVVIPAKTPVLPPPKKKRKKLHWGMEIKERWERKANM